MSNDSSIITITTNSGLSIIAQSQLGASVTFTKIKIGDGFVPTSVNPEELNDLINTLQTLDIYSKETIDDKTINITGIISPAQTASYFREIGVFAIDPQTGKEVLYAYGNKGDKASYIPPNDSNLTVEEEASLIVTVGNAATTHITINVDYDTYAKKDLSNLTAEGNAKIQYLPFCVNSGAITDGVESLLSIDGDIIIAQAPFTLTSAEGITKTVAADLTIDVSGLADGEYTILYNFDTNALEAFGSKIHTDKKFPDNAVVGDMLFDISVAPYKTLLKTDTDSRIAKYSRIGCYERTSGGGG